VSRQNPISLTGADTVRLALHLFKYFFYSRHTYIVPHIVSFFKKTEG
jgi:hypothetical protein